MYAPQRPQPVGVHWRQAPCGQHALALPGPPAAQQPATSAPPLCTAPHASVPSASSSSESRRSNRYLHGGGAHSGDTGWGWARAGTSRRRTGQAAGAQARHYLLPIQGDREGSGGKELAAKTCLWHRPVPTQPGHGHGLLSSPLHTHGPGGAPVAAQQRHRRSCNFHLHAQILQHSLRQMQAQPR